MGCFICDKKIVFHDNPTVMECSICHKRKETHQWCENGHFICFDCFYPLDLEWEEKWEKEEAERVKNFTLSDVDLDKLRETLDYYQKHNADLISVPDWNYPKECYGIFQLLPTDMDCIEKVDALVERHGGYIDDLDFNSLTLHDIIALISYMDVQDRIWDTISYFINKGIAVKLLRRLEFLCTKESANEDSMLLI